MFFFQMFSISKTISQIIEPILGMFVLIWMHSNFTILIFFTKCDMFDLSSAQACLVVCVNGGLLVSVVCIHDSQNVLKYTNSCLWFWLLCYLPKCLSHAIVCKAILNILSTDFYNPITAFTLFSALGIALTYLTMGYITVYLFLYHVNFNASDLLKLL